MSKTLYHHDGNDLYQGRSGGDTVTPWTASAPPIRQSLEEPRSLKEAFRTTLEKGLHGLCFSPYLDGQGPGSSIAALQIRSRLEIVRSHVRWIRSFSCTEGHEATPRIAHELGLNTLAGMWLGADSATNEREFESAVAIARAGYVDILAVGNEVLLREDLSEDELLGYLRRAKQALPGIPIGYVDAYFLFEKHPRVTQACDVVLANCYPFWEGCPLDEAVPYMQTMYARALATAPGKPVIISETGWPHRGTAFHSATPSVDGAMRYFIESQQWARDHHVPIFYFAAFDEAWKVAAEGDVGAFWGLWNQNGQHKFI
ncbi:MAG: glycosyl hydrolase [Proteobacteria bacterium]|nr:glycosyl hydrolase [Pseudomonadota bacterium]